MKLAKACNALHPEQPRRILLVGWVVKTEIPGHFCFAVSCPPYELGSGGAGATSPVLYLVYVRGKAYQASNQGKEAAAEYQKSSIIAVLWAIGRSGRWRTWSSLPVERRRP